MDKDALITEALGSFRPKFRTLDDDAHNLADHARKFARGRIPDAAALRFPGLALGKGTAFEQLIALYFAEARGDLVEAHFKIDEWGRGLPHRAMRARFHQFAAMGEGPRAVRCWQHYIRKNATMFWQDLRDRDAALRKRKANKTDDAEVAFHQTSLDTSKRVTLEAIALARRPFEAFGTAREQDWLARTETEIRTEDRGKVAAKPLADAMDDALFWALLTSGGDTPDDRLDTLPDRLAAYDAKAIKTFGQMVTDRMAEAYREDIWALAYLLMDGCSDDAFHYFRTWLLLQGQATFDGVLRDPDAFDPAQLRGQQPLAEGLMAAVEQAHVLRKGTDLPRLRQPKTRHLALDEDRFATLLPNVKRRLQ